MRFAIQGEKPALAPLIIRNYILAYTKLIGELRLRQVRLKSGTCKHVADSIRLHLFPKISWYS
jgi:hypothetical protein